MEENKKMERLNQKEISESAESIEDADNSKSKAIEGRDNSTGPKTIKILEKNLWTYGSPIIFQSGAVVEGSDGLSDSLVLNFTNIFKGKLQEVNLKIIVTKPDGIEEEIEQNYTSLGLDYLNSAGADAHIDIDGKATNIDIKVERVVFEDGLIWSKEETSYESTGEINDLDVFAQAKLKDYEDNYIIAKEDIAKEDYINMGNGIEILKRISWYKDSKKILTEAERKYNVLKHHEDRRKKIADKKASRKQSVKRKYVITSVVVVCILALVGAGFAAFTIPNNKYKDAKKLLNDKKYQQAAKKFDDLNGFLKSEEYLAEAYYNLGLNALENKDEDKASDYFEKSYNADKESQHGAMAGAFLDYYKGMDKLAEGDYDTAEKLLKQSSDAASDFNLINKASAGMAEILYLQKDYETSFNTIKNVYAKDKSYEESYGKYGYAYAKSLVDAGKIKKGMKLYSTIAKYTTSENLNVSVYKQAVKLGEKGNIDEAMKLLKSIKSTYGKANKLYNKMKNFNYKVRFWVGTWWHKGVVEGENKTYRIYISQVLYKGTMCLKIKDLNNKVLGFETVLSRKNKVTQIQIGTYQLHFKLKKYSDQKFTYTLKGGRKMIRELKYDKQTYKTKYKKKTK